MKNSSTRRSSGLRRRLRLVRHRPEDDDVAMLGAAPASPQATSSSLPLTADAPTLSPTARAPSVARKGVSYARDGAVFCCRFCEILQSGDADFVYEDDTLAVFRPLAPVVDSHVLVVPRCHIRNINQLTHDHTELLQRMRDVAERVLSDRSAKQSDAAVAVEFKFAFHKPPFNSIDHVHMHAFRKSPSLSGLGAIKFHTETWWCRSFEEVLDRASTSGASSSSTPSGSSLSSSSSSSCDEDASPRSSSSFMHSHNTSASAWRLGDQQPRAPV